MNEYNHLANSIDVQTFDATNGTDWMYWYKPKNARFIRVLAVGAGGGGAGGSGSNSAVNGYGMGGSGGGGGAVVTLFIPAFLLPDTLYVQVGIGGGGGAGGWAALSPGAGGIGVAGGSTTVAITMTGGGSVAIAGGGGGGLPTTNPSSGVYSPGAGGTAGGGSSFFSNLGLFSVVNENATGTTALGSNNLNSADINVTSFGTTGGTGGGSIKYVGGASLNIAGTSGSIIFPQNTYLTYANILGSGQNIPGNPGILFSRRKPFVSSGGTGGGGGNPCGVNGASGALGCGGGGGGSAGYAGCNCGSGGSGGNGFAIITSY